MPNTPNQPFGPSKQIPSLSPSQSHGGGIQRSPFPSPSQSTFPGQTPIQQSASPVSGSPIQSPIKQSPAQSNRQASARAKVDQLTASDHRGHDGSSLRSQSQASGDLVSQTPGLDFTRPIRDVGIRLVSWMRERPILTAGILGGVALGVVTPFIVRRFI